MSKRIGDLRWDQSKISWKGFVAGVEPVDLDLGEKAMSTVAKGWTPFAASHAAFEAVSFDPSFPKRRIPVFHKLTFLSILPCFAVFLVLLTLKLVHVIDWSWWWITVPLWPAACGLVVVGLGVISLIWIGNRWK